MRFKPDPSRTNLGTGPEKSDVGASADGCAMWGQTDGKEEGVMTAFHFSVASPGQSFHYVPGLVSMFDYLWIVEFHQVQAGLCHSFGLD